MALGGVGERGEQGAANFQIAPIQNGPNVQVICAGEDIARRIGPLHLRLNGQNIVVPVLRREGRILTYVCPDMRQYNEFIGSMIFAIDLLIGG